MAASEDQTPKDFALMSQKERKIAIEELENDPVVRAEMLYQLWWRCADFHLTIKEPVIEVITPGILIPPEPLVQSDGVECVYNILDSGNQLSTSKGEQMYSAGLSMYKLYNTIEKMMYLLKERLQSGGFDDGSEVQVTFDGFELAKRKAFEVIINFSQNLNVIVTNYDPGAWGEHFLRNVKFLADKGYGYPSEAPRESYRHDPQSAKTKLGRS